MGTMCSACSAKELEENDLKVTDFSEKERPNKSKSTKKNTDTIEAEEEEEAIGQEPAQDAKIKVEEDVSNTADEKVNPPNNALAEMDTVLKAVEAGHPVPETNEAAQKTLLPSGALKSSEANPYTPLEKEVSALDGLNTPCAPSVLFTDTQNASQEQANGADRVANERLDNTPWSGFQQAPQEPVLGNPFEDKGKPQFWEDCGVLAHRMASIENWLSTIPEQAAAEAGVSPKQLAVTMPVMENWAVFPDLTTECCAAIASDSIPSSSVRPWRRLPSVGTWLLERPHTAEDHAACTTPRCHPAIASVNLLQFDASPAGGEARVQELPLHELPFIGSPACTPEHPASESIGEAFLASFAVNSEVNEAAPDEDAESSEEDHYSFEDTSSSSGTPSSSSYCRFNTQEEQNLQKEQGAAAWLAELSGLDFNPTDAKLQGGIPFIGSLPTTPTGASELSPKNHSLEHPPAANYTIQALPSGPTLLGSQPSSPQKVMVQWPLSPKVNAATIDAAMKELAAAPLVKDATPHQPLPWNLRPSVGSWLSLPPKAQMKAMLARQAPEPRTRMALGAFASVAKQAKRLE